MVSVRQVLRKRARSASRTQADWIHVLRYVAVAFALGLLWTVSLFAWPFTREPLGVTGLGLNIGSPEPFVAFSLTTVLMAVPLWPWLLERMRWRRIIGLGVLGALGGAAHFMWVLCLVDSLGSFPRAQLPEDVRTLFLGLLVMPFFGIWGFVLASPVAVPLGVLCVACLRWAKTGRFKVGNRRNAGAESALA